MDRLGALFNSRTRQRDLLMGRSFATLYTYDFATREKLGEQLVREFGDDLTISPVVDVLLRATKKQSTIASVKLAFIISSAARDMRDEKHDNELVRQILATMINSSAQFGIDGIVELQDAGESKRTREVLSPFLVSLDVRGEAREQIIATLNHEQGFRTLHHILSN